MPLKRSSLQILCILAFVVITGMVHAQQSQAKRFPDQVVTDFGAFDCLDKHLMMTGFVDFQYQFGIKERILRPFVGFLFHLKSGYFFYGGIVLPIELSKRLIVQPSFAPGLYLNGDGLDLGFPIEFRTAFALIVKIKDRFYLGLEFAHISNASIFDADNPGLETLGLLFRFPLTEAKQ